MNCKPMRISIVGGGYVGLSLACMFVAKHTVVLYDIDSEKVNKINHNQAPIEDSSIKEWFAGENYLKILATTEPSESYTDADIVIISVPTDFDEETKEFRTAAVIDTVNEILSFKGNPLIVIKSTVPIGFTDKLRHETGYQRILFCPEFLREGTALKDNLFPSRIVVGANKEDSALMKDAEWFAQLLLDCCSNQDSPVLVTDSSEAEAIKLFSNAYLALRVAFFNELDSFAEDYGLNADAVITGMGLDPRIGQFYNNPSFGYGGYCLPKDTRQLRAEFDDTPQKLINAIIESNHTRMDYIAEQALLKAGRLKQANPSRDIVIGIYRVNMKKDSDNYRQSASMAVLDRIAGKGYTIEVFEPLLAENTLEDYTDVRLQNDLDTFKKDCHIILANRFESCLEDVKEKVYTRDLFSNN